MQIYRYSNQDEEKWPPGIERVQLVTGFAFYDKIDGKYDTSHISDVALEHGLDVIESKEQTTPLVLDIESFHWAQNPNLFEFYESESAKALKAYRERFPYRRLGVYGFMPVRSYWNPVTYIKTNNNKDAYDQWKELNRKFMSDEENKGLTELVDITSPSLYTFYDSMEDWKIYAEETVKTCREYQKPIMAWLWPLFHQGGKYKTKDYEGADPPKPRPYIGDDYVRTQLHFLASLDIEAVVIFNSAGIPDSFYDVIKEFESGAPPIPPSDPPSDPGAEPDPKPTTTTLPPRSKTTEPPIVPSFTTEPPSGGGLPQMTTQPPQPPFTTTTQPPQPPFTTTPHPQVSTTPAPPSTTPVPPPVRNTTTTTPPKIRRHRRRG